MTTLLYELRYGTRMLLKNPGFTFAVLVTLTLGIASTKQDQANIRIATPDYFRTMGIPLVRGRNFNEHDIKGSTLVTIINEQTAKDVFPGEDPIGQFIENYGPKNEKLQVVGVVGNVRHLALETTPRPEIYQPLGQGIWPLIFVAVKTAPESPVTLLPAVQQAVWSVNKSVALGNPRSMNEMVFGVAASFGLTRLIASLLYGISASDPVTFFLLSTALVLVAFIACWLPARRASAVDPTVALHAE